jgi:hypothetical protein
LQQAEDGRQGAQLPRGGGIALENLVGELEELGDGFGRAEVVVHRFLEARGVGLGPVDKLGPRLRGDDGVAVAQSGVETGERLLGVFEVGLGVVDRGAVMRAQNEKPDHFGVVVLKHFAQHEEIAERLGHLLVVDADELVVHPVLHELLVGGTLGLRDLVLMVRELEVHAAAVDVEGRTEQRRAHRRALDVPAGPALAPARRPFRLVGLGPLPQHEVERVLLGGIDVDALAGAQLVQRFAGELAVALEAAHGVVHVAGAGLVSELFVFQPVDEIQHLRHVLRGARLVIRFLDAERGRVLVHGADEARGQGLDRLLVLGGALDDLVVDVRDVADIGDAVAARAQPAPHHVEHDHETRVAEVHVVVDGDAADVHAHLVRPEADERLLGPAKRIEDLQVLDCGPAGVGLECKPFVGP